MAEAMLATDAGPSVGLVQRQYFTFASEDEPFVLENGQTLPEVVTCYETYGRLNEAGDNAVLITHGITGSSHAAGRYRPDSPYAGYWEELIGPGKAIDTDRYFVIAPNSLGGCRGTTGPSSVDPRTGRPYALRFPIITIRDMVRAQKPLLDHLGVKRLALVTGGSMGGMQALEWAVTYPESVAAVAAIATNARQSAQGIAFNECARRAIMLDPRWNKGDYYGFEPPNDGLALARMIGTITYLSDPIMEQMFGRKPFAQRNAREHDLHARFDVERYLHSEGALLVKRFDANTYLYVSRAIDLHDISRGYGSLENAYKRIQARLLLVGIRSDILFYPYVLREMHAHLVALGKDSTYWEMDSEYGHDAFLVEQQKLAEPLRAFLGSPRRPGS
jgi:homoserine O-acetyltransferase